MQVLDTSITNVALPHMQGSFSASIDEMSWVITSYLAANAVIIPASGWLTSVFGRRRFYLICTVIFTTSSFLSGIAPNLEFLVAMRNLAGAGRRPGHPDGPGHHVGDLPAQGARHRAGGVGLRHHAGADPGTDRRRLDRRQLVVAVDLLHQPADRRGRLLHDQRLPLRRVLPAQAAACGRARHRADDVRLRLPAAGPRRRRAAGLVRLHLHRHPQRAGRLHGDGVRGPRDHGRGADPRPQACSATGTSAWPRSPSS